MSLSQAMISCCLLFYNPYLWFFISLIFCILYIIALCCLWENLYLSNYFSFKYIAMYKYCKVGIKRCELVLLLLVTVGKWSLPRGHIWRHSENCWGYTTEENCGQTVRALRIDKVVESCHLFCTLHSAWTILFSAMDGSTMEMVSGGN